MLPPVSVPSPKSTSPALTVMAAPLLEPPGMWPASSGLRPTASGLAPLIPSAISCRWVLPIRVAPSSSNRVTNGLGGNCGSAAFVDARSGQPLTS